MHHHPFLCHPDAFWQHFIGFFNKKTVLLPVNFTHLFSGHISTQLPVNLEKGLNQTSFFQMIKRC